MMDGNEHVTVATAADLAGVPARTLRYWVETGKLPAIAGKHGRLVRLGDVREIASLTGKDGNLGNLGNSFAAGKVTAMVGLAGNLAAEVAEGSSGLAEEQGNTSVTAATMMQQMVQQIVAPLADANERLTTANERQAAELARVHEVARQQAEELGRERAMREAAEREADELRRARRQAPWWLRLLLGGRWS